ncbi:MAG TPA: alpha/beta hydrolase [Candidatus Polarisedimenticolaceae bacterium]
MKLFRLAVLLVAFTAPACLWKSSPHRLPLPTGVRVHVVEAGDPKGEAVVFLHGLTDTSRSFAPVIEKLATLRPDLRLIAVDQRGHGASSMPQDRACKAAPERCFAVEDFARDVIATLDALQVDRAHLVGHSMGGAVAQETALSRPDRVASVTLVATSADMRENPVVRDYLLAERIEGSWKRGLESKGLRFPDDAWELVATDADPRASEWMATEWVTEANADAAFVQSVLPETLAIRLGTWIGATRGLRAFDVRSRLSDLKVPALVISGKDDPVFPQVPDQADLRSALEEAHRENGVPVRFRVLDAPGLGHNLPWGAPEPIADELSRFLGRPAEG